MAFGCPSLVPALGGTGYQAARGYQRVPRVDLISSIAGETLVPMLGTYGYERVPTVTRYPPVHPFRGTWLGTRPTLAFAGILPGAYFRHQAHCARSACVVNAKSHAHTTTHPPLTSTARVARIPGDDTPTRYVKAEVVHHLYTAVTDIPRKVYVLDRATDRAR